MNRYNQLIENLSRIPFMRGRTWLRFDQLSEAWQRLFNGDRTAVSSTEPVVTRDGDGWVIEYRQPV